MFITIYPQTYYCFLFYDINNIRYAMTIKYWTVCNLSSERSDKCIGSCCMIFIFL